ncbi:MAG TPA: hypothetical protein VGO93_10175 [Candidatus Xenobia bacterium]
MGKRGRPPTVAREHLDKYSGSPILAVRLPGAIWEVAKARGGAAWVKSILMKLLHGGAVTVQDQDAFRRQVEAAVTGSIRAVKHDHPGRDPLDLAGSVAKRVSAQLWGAMKLPEPEPPAVKEKPVEEQPPGLASDASPAND